MLNGFDVVLFTASTVVLALMLLRRRTRITVAQLSGPAMATSPDIDQPALNRRHSDARAA